MNHPRPLITDMFLTNVLTYEPGRVSPTGPDYDEYGLAGLLEALTTSDKRDCASEVVLWLDATAAAALKMPTRADQLPAEGEHHLCEIDLYEAGWDFAGNRPGQDRTSRIDAWNVLVKEGRPIIRLGLVHCANSDNPALPGLMLHKGTGATLGLSTPMDAVEALHRWRVATGTAWSGTPQMSAHSHMRALVRYRPLIKQGPRKGQADPKADEREPRWFAPMPAEVTPVEENYAQDRWKGRRAQDGDKTLHGWDVIKAHTATAQAVHVSPFKLEHTGVIPYTKDRQGWWLARISPWLLPYLPPPWGAYPDEMSSEKGRYIVPNPVTRWVSGPTLALLDEIQDPEKDFTFNGRRIHDGYEVLDSWTAGAARPLLKPWAESVKALMTEVAEPDPGRPSDQMLKDMVKMAANRGIGALRSPGGRIERPDWHDAIVSQNRSNLWRKLWKIAVASEWKALPRFIATDCVYYPSTSYEPTPPPGMKTDPAGLQIGSFKYEKSVGVV